MKVSASNWSFEKEIVAFNGSSRRARSLEARIAWPIVVKPEVRVRKSLQFFKRATGDSRYKPRRRKTIRPRAGAAPLRANDYAVFARTTRAFIAELLENAQEGAVVTPVKDKAPSRKPPEPKADS
jgi:hypothetical protein